MARGPAYPYFDLEKAVTMTRKIYDHGRKSPMVVDSVIKDVFEMSPSSSSAAKSIAALKYFGLLSDASGATSKQVQLTDRALLILFQTENSKERAQALKDAALNPSNYAYCWKLWGSELPSDAAMRAHLILEKHFVDSTVDGFLSDYKKTIKFANLLGGSNSSQESNSPKSTGGDSPSIEIGDHIQWESGGIMQFQTPRKVISKSPDDQYVFVEGSSTGIPVSEVKIMTSSAAVGNKPETPATPPPPLPRAPKTEAPLGMQQATMPLVEGDAVLQWPKSMSQESYQDFKEWVELMLRRARRSITNAADDPSDDGQD